MLMFHPTTLQNELHLIKWMLSLVSSIYIYMYLTIDHIHSSVRPHLISTIYELHLFMTNVAQDAMDLSNRLLTRQWFTTHRAVNHSWLVWAEQLARQDMHRPPILTYVFLFSLFFTFLGFCFSTWSSLFPLEGLQILLLKSHISA